MFTRKQFYQNLLAATAIMGACALPTTADAGEIPELPMVLFGTSNGILGNDAAAQAYLQFKENVLLDDMGNGFIQNHTLLTPGDPGLTVGGDPLRPGPTGVGNLDPLGPVPGNFIPDSQIIMPESGDARMYFISEEAGFNNALGFITNAAVPADYNFMNGGQVIFNPINANGDNGGALNNMSEDDYVNLGTFNAGTSFDFFIQQEGGDVDRENANPAEKHDFWGTAEPPIYWSNPDENDATGGGVYGNGPFQIPEIEGRRHTLTWSFDEGAYRYFLMGFEDQNNRGPVFDVAGEFGFVGQFLYFDPAAIDHTDAIVVLQVPITEVPEPATYMVLGTFLMAAVRGRRKQLVRVREHH